MAKRPLTPTEKANFAARNAASKKSTANAKAKASGIDPSKIKIKTRSAKEIEAAIKKAKADPKFMAKFKNIKTPRGGRGMGGPMLGGGGSRGPVIK